MEPIDREIELFELKVYRVRLVRLFDSAIIDGIEPKSSYLKWILLTLSQTTDRIVHLSTILGSDS